MEIVSVRKVALAVMAVGLVALGGACADEDRDELLVVGTEMAFDAPASVPAGSYTLRFANEGAVFHEVAIRPAGEAAGGKVLRRVTAAAGQEASTDVELAPGRYELGCFEPGHYDAGMKRLLEVRG